MKGNSITHHNLKKAYATKEEAEKVVAYLLIEGIEIRSYKCFCGIYHLSSRKDR